GVCDQKIQILQCHHLLHTHPAEGVLFRWYAWLRVLVHGTTRSRAIGENRNWQGTLSLSKCQSAKGLLMNSQTLRAPASTVCACDRIAAGEAFEPASDPIRHRRAVAFVPMA